MLQPGRFEIPADETRTFTPDLNGLIAWLETQDGALAYDWWSTTDCLFFRFAKVTPIGELGYRTELYGRFTRGRFPRPAFIANGGDNTYAAALTRAKSLREKGASK